MNIDSQLSTELDQISLEDLESIYSRFSGFEFSPVDIITFIRDKYFLGTYFSDDNGKVSFYQYWYDVLLDIYPSPHISPYWLIGFRGSIGRGKTMAACTALLYDIYILQCMKSPQTFFGLLKTDRIVAAIMNVTLSLTRDVIWDRIFSMMASSPYFSNLLDISRVLGKMKSRIIKDSSSSILPKNIDFFSGSRITHTLGRSIRYAIFSEANFEVVDEQVYKSFNSVIARMESRFLDEGGVTSGKVFIDTSEGDRASTINRIMDKYKGQSGVFVNTGPLWEIRPWNYRGEYFYVYTGNDLRKPDLIDSDDPVIEDEPDKVMKVPVEHRNRFLADLEQALRDLGGVATISSYLLFRNRLKLLAAMVMSPLFPDVLSVDFEDPEDQIHKYCSSPLYFKINKYKGVPRHLHIDIGISGDRLGIGCSCITGFKETEVSQDIITMASHRDIVPTTLTDFAFAVQAKKGQQIPLYKVRQFIMWLRSCGMMIGKVTADGYQSADLLQLMKLARLESDVLSVDKTSDPYTQLRNAVNEGRSILPTNAVLRKEFEHLEVSPDGRKVDHPLEFSDGTKGSKDIADAVAGSVVSAIADASRYRLIYTDWPEETEDSAKQLASTFWPEKYRE